VPAVENLLTIFKLGISEIEKISQNIEELKIDG